MRKPSRAVTDAKLIQIVTSALDEAARKSGDWLVCRLGCTQCCVGVFAINQLDADRLRKGLAILTKDSPERAARIRQRARESVSRHEANFPGDSRTGILDDGPDAEGRFAEFANDEPCPALDPVTGGCELYEARPLTCRVFGPPVRSDEGIGVCELCYQGAADEQVSACEVDPDPDDLESVLVEQIERSTGVRGNTTVAYCLAK